MSDGCMSSCLLHTDMEIFLCIHMVSVVKLEDNWTHVLSGSIGICFKYAQQNKF